MIATSLGQMSLNIAFALYSVVYLPQVIHNHRSPHFAQLSLGLHFLLYLGAFFDLLYGFASQLPWQYKTVSIVSLLLVSVQHIQLIRFFMANSLSFLKQVSMVILIAQAVGIYCFFDMDQSFLSDSMILIMGVVARLCGFLYCIPQIIKNKLTQSTQGLSAHFVYLNFLLAMLETIYSWCLNWGWPNKLAAPINIIFMLILLRQTKKYNSQDLRKTPNSSLD